MMVSPHLSLFFSLKHPMGAHLRMAARDGIGGRA